MGEHSGAVNFAYLEGFTAGDTRLMREVLKVFCSEAAEWANRLDAEPDDWRRVIHTMKGTSRSVGADALGDLCQQAEGRGPEMLPQVRAALDGVIAEVRAWIEAHPA
jgi:HPt (histidine-containing phosphotransfer) domain-containing protein